MTYDDLVIIVDEDHVLIEKKITPKNNDYSLLSEGVQNNQQTNTNKKDDKPYNLNNKIDQWYQKYISPNYKYSIHNWSHEKVIGCMCIGYGLLYWLIS